MNKHFRSLPALAALFLLAACGDAPSLLPPQGFTNDEIKASKTAVVVAGLQITDDHGLLNCLNLSANVRAAVPLSPVDGANVTFFGASSGSRTLVQRTLPGGSYEITELQCSNPGGGGTSAIKNFAATPGKPFAAFFANPGEVVDLGLLSVDVVLLGKDGAGNNTMSELAIVRALPADMTAQIRGDVSKRLVTRHMTPARVASPSEIAERCALQKSRDKTVFGIGASNPPGICDRQES